MGSGLILVCCRAWGRSEHGVAVFCDNRHSETKPFRHFTDSRRGYSRISHNTPICVDLCESAAYALAPLPPSHVGYHVFRPAILFILSILSTIFNLTKGFAYKMRGRRLLRPNGCCLTIKSCLAGTTAQEVSETHPALREAAQACFRLWVANAQRGRETALA
jgi:hypothetical protein